MSRDRSRHEARYARTLRSRLESASSDRCHCRAAFPPPRSPLTLPERPAGKRRIASDSPSALLDALQTAGCNFSSVFREAQLLALSTQVALDAFDQRHEPRVVAKSGEDFVVEQHQMPAIVNRALAFGLLERVQSRFCPPAQRERFRGVPLLDEESSLSAQLQNRFQMVQHLVRPGLIACCAQRAAIVCEVESRER